MQEFSQSFEDVIANRFLAKAKNGDVNAEKRERIGKHQTAVVVQRAEILRLLNKYRDSGKKYKEIGEWLNVMSSTTTISEGAVYLAGKKVWAKDRFHHGLSAQ